MAACGLSLVAGGDFGSYQLVGVAHQFSKCTVGQNAEVRDRDPAIAPDVSRALDSLHFQQLGAALRRRLQRDPVGRLKIVGREDFAADAEEQVVFPLHVFRRFGQGEAKFAKAVEGHFSFNAFATSSAWPSALTLGKTRAMCPSGSITNVVRSMPITFFPYMFFSFTTPYRLAIFLSTSASSVNGRSYLSLNFFWAEGVSAETPSTVAPAFWICLYASRNPHASTVQPGVSALGKK